MPGRIPPQHTNGDGDRCIPCGVFRLHRIRRFRLAESSSSFSLKGNRRFAYHSVNVVQAVVLPCETCKHSPKQGDKTVTPVKERFAPSKNRRKALDIASTQDRAAC